MNYKKETWLVFYRTLAGKLTSAEYDCALFNRGDALVETMRRKRFKCFETSINGPIVKRMCYV